ncbi:DUF3344 domain-containing protein [Streptomyces sp. P38-E01]|uniref:DUF3344 domain-containing protein n=1 Tax=Streptomyces tardus TaxID=2780544 RepID=A0A949JTG7_9ACTN|nr:DUF3344 domain-containing protein [Streptomyces tardus]MBU7599830.1 DUF3344 domain-containing protein [Streptomyces tardus]
MRTNFSSAGRGAWCVLATALAVSVLPSAAVSAPGVKEQLPFTQRYSTVQHGGFAQAANSAITCRSMVRKGAGPCPAAQRGAGVNGDYEMFYIDVDDDPDTYNSSRAQLKLPSGSRVTHARLYWGGNLRVGEQKPPKDNGRVLLAEQGGSYTEVFADSVIAHRTTKLTDSYQASADVTDLVRRSGSGSYTVAQLNVAMGHSAAGAWGGWTMVAAYENDRSPERRLALWDGYRSVTPKGGDARVTLTGLGIPAGSRGTASVVAYDGDRGVTGDGWQIAAKGKSPMRLNNSANPAADAMNSTISDLGRPVKSREPAHENTLGYDSDRFDVTAAVKHGADSLSFYFTPGADGFHLGVLAVAATTGS